MPVRLGLAVLLMMAGAAPSWAMGTLSPVVDEVLIGKQAPDIMLEKNTGGTANVVASREGKKAVLIFWATWCPHCRAELSKVNILLPSIEEKGIKVILVNVGESKDAVNAYLQRHHIDLGSFMDEETVLQRPYNLTGVPTLVFIDANGIVRHTTYEFPDDYTDMFK